MKVIQNAENKIAMQHHQLTSNNLFTAGRAGLKRIVESTWEGSYSNDSGEKVSYTIEAEGTRTMNAYDQDLFLYLLYLHRIRSKWELEDGDKTELKTKGDAAINQHVTLKITGYELIKQLGWNNGGRSYKRLLNCLDRIGRVYLVCNYEDSKVKRRWSSHILYHDYELNKFNGDEKIEVTLCPLLALAAHRQGAELHSSHCLTEREKLSNNVKILHAAICSRLRPGKSQRFKTDTLISYLYGTLSLDRRVRSKTKKDIIRLGELSGWKVSFQSDSDNWLISRPKLNNQ